MILGEGESTGTNEAKDLTSNEEPEKFENDAQDEIGGEFDLSLLFVNNISLKKSEHIKEWGYRMNLYKFYYTFPLRDKSHEDLFRDHFKMQEKSYGLWTSE